MCRKIERVPGHCLDHLTGLVWDMGSTVLMALGSGRQLAVRERERERESERDIRPSTNTRLCWGGVIKKRRDRLGSNHDRSEGVVNARNPPRLSQPRLVPATHHLIYSLSPRLYSKKMRALPPPHLREPPLTGKRAPWLDSTYVCENEPRTEEYLQSFQVLNPDQSSGRRVFCAPQPHTET